MVMEWLILTVLAIGTVIMLYRMSRAIYEAEYILQMLRHEHITDEMRQAGAYALLEYETRDYAATDKELIAEGVYQAMTDAKTGSR